VKQCNSNNFCNLKKGKPEFILYHKKLSKEPKTNIIAGSTPLQNDTVYEYLGVLLNNSLSLKHLELNFWYILTYHHNLCCRTNLQNDVSLQGPLLLGLETIVNRYQKVQDCVYKVVLGDTTLNKWNSIQPTCCRL
jgi:hypothetical protein